MRIAMLAAGSRGDYQPVLAVARGLAARGHEVGVTATSDFVGLVRKAGVRPEEVAVDAMGYYRDDALRQGMPVGLAAQLELLREVARALAPAVRATMTDLLPRYDALVTTAMTSAWAGMVGGPRKPQVLMMFVPAIPSAWGDSSLFSVRPGRSVHNLAAGVRAMGPAMRLASADPAATWRERLRGLRQLATSPVFVANSAQIVTPRRVGGRLVRATGYPFRDLPEGSALPAPVADFLDAGAAPVYVGLGSHTVPTVREAMRHTVDAALGLGHRAVVQRGSGLEEEAGYDDRVLFVGDAPHELLFARTAAVVHHGGAGTTAQALRASRPQVLMPFTMDQPFFARRVHEIGVGSRPVPTSEATPDRLRAALETALDPAVADRAAEVGFLVRQEDGVGGAVAFIEGELLR
ncbi:glycosyltransferase [Ornithinimicrobium pratense]|uniref:Glycosyltransferase family 1 protein n=1 Tax=Ornithinimicrobium pratense TaxID=2593973 RepID=A0A5J6V9G9_9MICO|nr:glycosyltransferase [Ornithinimicrobium pratense]QFG69984.1 glycosyltransferase family 1 protein [Ornithinimicrobium pratense]